MDPQLSRIAFLCNQLQTQCKKNNNLRTLAIDSLEEILQKFDNILNSNSKPTKTTNATKQTKELAHSKSRDAKVEPLKNHTDARNHKKEEAPVVQEPIVKNAPGYNKTVKPLTKYLAPIDTVVPYEEEPQSLLSKSDNDIDLNSSWGPTTRGRGLASLTRPTEKIVEESPKVPTAMVSSLGYLLGGTEGGTQNSSGKLRDPSPFQRRPSHPEPPSTYPTLKASGKSASAPNVQDTSLLLTPTQEYHPRFRYSQASPEEKAALEKKFRAQAELRNALLSQMEERKEPPNGRRTNRS